MGKKLLVEVLDVEIHIFCSEETVSVNKITVLMVHLKGQRDLMAFQIHFIVYPW